MASPDPLLQVFDAAKREFEDGLPSHAQLRDLSAFNSIDKVWEAVEKLQANQSKRNHQRALGRIRPFLERLQSYAIVVDTFVQVKPDIMALIWGPIRLLLVWTSEWTQGFDAIVKTMERVGDLLPQFGDVTRHFIDKDRIKDVLGLFYRDILDFHLEILKFFTLPRMRAPSPPQRYETVLLTIQKVSGCFLRRSGRNAKRDSR